MIELKFGRKVVAWSWDGDKKDKGAYLAYDKTMYKPHLVLIWNKDMGGEYCPVAVFYKHVKPDLSAEPMNGDEVECSDDKINWDRVFFIGKTKNQRYITESFAGEPLEFKYVRHPQPSKREMVIEFLNSYYYPCNAEKIADQIDKIYTEDE